MTKSVISAGMALLAVFGLGACSKKAPECGAEGVRAYLLQDDGLLEAFIDKRYEISEIVDGGMDENMRRCSAVLTTTITLKADLPVIMDGAKKASEGKGITEQLNIGTYLTGLTLLGLEKQGDTSTDKSTLTYATGYTTEGETVVTVLEVR
ncbi:hypothetical protein WCX18_00505 [Sulfurimonas sp. HSL1-2]|uniref:hypothetical protein n=1 Tax=Thiomicrolovo zhangzhouensis TaxID=3131933 RepID=UPI0031F7E113